VARNYRCRYGEIDLIMQEGATLVFVEVRLRRNPNFAGAVFSVNRAKRNRLTASAQHYLQPHGRSGAARLDVVAIDRQNAWSGHTPPLKPNGLT
jgi:putative endonuclease